MNDQQRGTTLVSQVLDYFHTLLQKYEWRGHAYFKMVIGSEGMGPEITIFLRGSQFNPDSPQIEIQFWLPPDDTKYVLMYDALEPKSEDGEFISEDISNISEADQYFKKAFKLLGLKQLGSDQ